MRRSGKNNGWDRWPEAAHLSLCVLFFLGCASCAKAIGQSDAGADPDPDPEVSDTSDPAAEETEEPEACPPGLTLCGTTCVDLSSNHDNCGSCGNECLPAEVCSEGDCMLECPIGMTECDGGCLDTDTDILNCGGCGIVCTAGRHADPVCSGGICDIQCDDGYVDTDGDGDCEPITSSCTFTSDLMNNTHCDVNTDYSEQPDEEACWSWCESTLEERAETGEWCCHYQTPGHHGGGDYICRLGPTEAIKDWPYVVARFMLCSR